MTFIDTLVVAAVLLSFLYLILARLKKNGYDVFDYIKLTMNKFKRPKPSIVQPTEIKQQLWPEKVV